jgi:hypothetical protein
MNDNAAICHWLMTEKSKEAQLAYTQAQIDEAIAWFAAFAERQATLEKENERLMSIIVVAHDELLRGHSDKYILHLLRTGWNERPKLTTSAEESAGSFE